MCARRYVTHICAQEAANDTAATVGKVARRHRMSVSVGHAIMKRNRGRLMMGCQKQIYATALRIVSV